MSTVLRKVRRWKRRRVMLRQSRTRRVSRVVTWLLWSKARFLTIAFTVAALVVTGTVFYAADAAYRMQEGAYEQQVASEQSQAAVEAEGSVDGGMEWMDTPAEPTREAGERPDGSPPAPNQVQTVAATSAAARFLTAWASGHAAKSSDAWLKAMAPYASPVIIDGFRLTDPAQIPAGVKQSGLSLVETGGDAAGTVSLSGVGKVTLTLEQGDDAAWRVTGFEPADEHQ